MKAIKQNIKCFMIFLLFKIKRNIAHLIALNFLLSSCFRTSPPINRAQQAKITAFFEELLLEHGGAYTLFGSKPVTIEELVDCSEAAFQEMQQYLKEHPEVETILVDRKLEEGWEEWKKFPQKPFHKNYILTEVKCSKYSIIVFVNIKNTISVIRDHYGDFKRILGQDFDPTKVILQLRDGKQDIWKQMLNDYTLMGILFGYGYQNATLFEKRMRGELEDEGKASDCRDPRLKAECTLNNKPFRIPIFVMLDDTESNALVVRYKIEREKIKAIYEGKDFLDVTLDNLKRL